MSLEIIRLPLFPLHHVLFPFIPLPLHIFEERYKVMIQQCITQGTPFGVVLIEEGREIGTPARPHKIGCTARIVAAKYLEEGKIEIVTIGEERFRLLEYREVEIPNRAQEAQGATYNAPPPYLLGFAERLMDTADDAQALAIVHAEAKELFLHYLRALSAFSDTPLPRTDLPDEAQTLSYYIGAIMRLPLELKQQLLAESSTQARLEQEIKLLRHEIAQLEGYSAGFHQTPEKPLHPKPEPDALLKMSKEDWQDYFRRGRN